MTKALVVIFFQGPPIRHEYYRLTLEFFKLTLLKCKDQFDKIYLVDNSANFTTDDRDFLRQYFPKKAVIMLGQMDSHWEMMNTITKQVTEDAVLLVDSDTMIYDPWSVFSNFQLLENAYDVVSIFDSSGEDLGYPVLEDQRRFAPYMCFMDMEVLRKTSMNFYPDSTHDSMGLLTKELLDKGARAKRIPDDRATIYIDGTSTAKLQDEPGYYHQRNSNGGLHILTSWLIDRESYDRDVKLMPLSERCRLLAWVAIENKMTWDNERLSWEIMKIFSDWGINATEAIDYIEAFKSFHPWLERMKK